MSMFEHIPRVPGDAILGLIEAFKNDPRERKIDLGVGVYRDDAGHTPILSTVKAAERYLVEHETTKSYIGSHGAEDYGRLVTSLVFGADSEVLAQQRVSLTQSPGGTGALRLAADFLHTNLKGRSIWISDPTWPNHIGLFSTAGITIKRYPYVDDQNRFVFDRMLDALRHIPEGDIVLLHACCHNPTGYDLNREQWQAVLDVLRERHLLPLVDMAYQGFGHGLDEDAYGVRLLAEHLEAMIITFSCSKNFGIYNERTGAFILVAGNKEERDNVRSQAAITARENYSNPPAHGAAVVSHVLNDGALRKQWVGEVAEMRQRIRSLREQLVEALAQHGLRERFNCVLEQNGMFSYLGLSPEQVDYLRDEYGIYMVRSGRASMAGLRTEQVDDMAAALADAVKKFD